MDHELEAKIKENQEGFIFEHSVASKRFFWNLPEVTRYDHMTCSHLFDDKTGLEAMALLVKQLEQKPEMQASILQELHDFAFSCARSHTFEKDVFSWTRGENEMLRIDSEGLIFVHETWDDGNEYRSISPSADTYTWKVPKDLLNSFFTEMKVKSLAQLLSRFDSPDFFETLSALRKANNHYVRVEH
jgi:hypothetical protein